MIRNLAVTVPLLLGGCTGLIAAGSATGAIGGGLVVANTVAGKVDNAIDKACRDYQTGRMIANAVLAAGLLPSDIATKISLIEQYGDAACANPPSGDAVSTAIWLGTLIGQLGTLASAPPAT
jgi:hypothetical protein